MVGEPVGLLDGCTVGIAEGCDDGHILGGRVGVELDEISVGGGDGSFVACAGGKLIGTAVR